MLSTKTPRADTKRTCGERHARRLAMRCRRLKTHSLQEKVIPSDRACTGGTPWTWMVRRGSTVRVRQRASTICRASARSDYSLDRGITQLLIERGIEAGLIPPAEYAGSSASTSYRRLLSTRGGAAGAERCHLWQEYEGTMREHQRGHARPPAVIPSRSIPLVCGTFVVAVTRACPCFPSRSSMARRGSTVRVRQRALQKRRTWRFSFDRVAPRPACGGCGA
jgi:hypothetical protein